MNSNRQTTAPNFTRKQTGLGTLIFMGILTMTIANNAATSSQPESTWDEARWKQDLIAARASRDKRFVSSPTTYLAGIHHHRHEAKIPLYIHVSDSAIAYNSEKSPDSKMLVEPAGEFWTWRALDQSVTGSFGGETLQPGQLETGMLFDLGRFNIQIWKDEGRLEFGVFDHERDALKAYQGLVYYDPDSAYRYEAAFEQFEKVETVMVLTAGSGERPFLKYGTIHFNINGEPKQLTAYKNSAESTDLFIPFRDRTSGKATYGAGRFLNTPIPQGETIVLDLNKSINFPCAYAPAFHCPIPPRENWLTVGIEAGELDYPLPH